MMLSRLLRGGVWISGASTLSALASFFRNIFIARLISVEDFGIASALAMTMLIVEMASNLAVDRLIVQAPDGDTPEFMATAHAFQAIRGVIGAILVYILAGYVAILFKIPEATWAFEALALVPLIKGFTHLDTIRFQRKLRFAPTSWTELIPQIFSLIAAIPLASYFKDYSTMLWVIFIQIVVSTVLSHLFAERAYRWGWTGVIVGRMYSYGWPLLLNGFLMFIIFQGDKLIVGTMYSPEVLGWFSAAFAFALAPSMLATKVLQTIMLPVLTNGLKDNFRFRGNVSLVNDLCIFIGIAISIAFLLLGPKTLLFIFGEKYSAGIEIIGWLGLTQGIRVWKSGPLIISLAIKETKIPLVSNIPRLISVLVALLYSILGYSVGYIIIIGLIGELFAYLLSLYLLNNKIDIKNYIDIWRNGLLVFTLCLVVTVSHYTNTVYKIDVSIINLLLVYVLLLAFVFRLSGVFYDRAKIIIYGLLK